MDPALRPPTVAVFGSSTLREDDAVYAQVVELGGALARAGLAVMTGGYGGAMAAASRGANEAGGLVIGVTVDLFEARSPVNRWVTERVHTPSLFARLETIMNRADAFVAVHGSIGTLTEVFLAWTLVSVTEPPTPPVVLMGSHWREWLSRHDAPEFIPAHLFRFIEVADTPGETTRTVLAGLARTREAHAVASAPPGARS